MNSEKQPVGTVCAMLNTSELMLVLTHLCQVDFSTSPFGLVHLQFKVSGLFLLNVDPDRTPHSEDLLFGSVPFMER